jgi:hypothetical protein
MGAIKRVSFYPNYEGSVEGDNEYGDYVLYEDHLAELAELKQERDRLAKDAERYLWLRNHRNMNFAVEHYKGVLVRRMHGDFLDHEIDAEMGE